MKVTVFTENPAKVYGRMTNCEPTWHIRTKNHSILFVAGKSDSFWKYAERMEIDIGNIDIILLPQGCEDPIRELERFLVHNQRGKIYLPRLTYEKHFFELCNKMFVYSATNAMARWLERIVFMDETMQIDVGIQIFTGKVQEMYQSPQEQSMLLNEDGKAVLFINDEKETTDYMQEKAETLYGGDINYLFYKTPQQKCVGKDCSTRKMNAMTMGKAVII